MTMSMNFDTNSQFLVFKTNIHTKMDVTRLSPLLEADERIVEWNVDFSDIDKVLRIGSNELRPQEVIAMISHAGYACEELPD